MDSVKRAMNERNVSVVVVVVVVVFDDDDDDDAVMILFVRYHDKI